MHGKRKVAKTIVKLLSPCEEPFDAQNARQLILYTHQTKDGELLWKTIDYRLLTSERFTAWKYCNLLHRLCRDGHPQVVAEALKKYAKLESLSEYWRLKQQHQQQYQKESVYSIAQCIVRYCELLKQKLQLLDNYKYLNGRLELSGGEHTEVSTCFALCCDLFDMIEQLLRLQHDVLAELQQQHIEFTTIAGKCRLIALITVAEEYADVYECLVKYMSRLCNELGSVDTAGLCERFEVLYAQLQCAYDDLNCIAFVREFISLPTLTTLPPNFYKPGWSAHYETPMPTAPLACELD